LASDPRYRSPNYAKTRDMVPILLNAQKHAMLHPIVNLLNVRYFISRTALTWPLKVIVHDRDYWVSENADALSRAFVPETVKQVDERVMIDQMDRIDFDARKTAYVMEDLGLPAECRGDVNLRDISPMEVELQVEMATDGLVVVSDMWDADWKGTIDGVPVPIIRTNTALRGIRTSSGKHVVRMEYRPAIVLTAFLGSLSAVFVIALWVIWLIVSSHSRWLVKGAKTGDQVDQP
jgi:hypothetical protein